MNKGLMFIGLLVVLMLVWSPALAQKPTATDPSKTKPPPMETEPPTEIPPTDKPPTEIPPTDKPGERPTQVWDDPNGPNYVTVQLPRSGYGPPESRSELTMLIVILIAAVIFVLAWLLKQLKV